MPFDDDGARKAHSKAKNKFMCNDGSVYVSQENKYVIKYTEHEFNGDNK